MEAGKISRSVIYFTLVGLLLGLTLVGTNMLLSFLNFDQLSINIIIVILLVILTGGLGLDGLADTADAFLSHKTKEEMLKIMRDSHIGVMGVLALVCIILLKIALLVSIDTSLKPASLLLMCVFSRWSMVFVMFLFPYAREEGKAKLFIQGTTLKVFILSTFITLACGILIWNLKGIFVLVIVTISAYLVGNLIKKKIGGITGDTLGAINELTEVIVLFIICLLERGGQWTI